MTRQDNKFEARQCAVFGLKHIDRRGNAYIPDALCLMRLQDSWKIMRGELKACYESGGSFSTSSRMGIDKLFAWNQGFDWAVFSVFNAEGEIIESYFLSHQLLEPFYKIVRDKQNKGHAGRAGLTSWVAARKVLEQQEFDPKIIEKLEKQNRFGSRINDPRISIKEIKEWGIKIEADKNSQHLKKLIIEHCSEFGWDPEKIDLIDPPKGFTVGSGKGQKPCPVLEELLEEWRKK